MCINLKSFNESFRDWNQKREEEQFFGVSMQWYGENNFEIFSQKLDTLNSKLDITSKPSIPLEVVSSPAVGTNLHNQRPDPQVNLDFDGNLVSVVRNPDTD